MPKTELNIPRGRSDSGSNFPRSSTLRDTGSGLKDSDRPKQSMHRRSNSMSRLSNKTTRSGDSKTSKYDLDPTGSSSLTDRSRSRTMSYYDDDDVSRKYSSKTDFSKTYTGSKSSYQLYEDSRSQSPRTSKTMPTLKKSLLSTDNTRLKSHKSGTSFGSRTSDDYGAFTRSPGRHSARSDSSEDDERGLGLHSLPADLNRHTFRDKFLRELGPERKLEICAICLDEVKHPEKLPCAHTFCSECINQHFKRSKPTCPTCGSVYGKVVGTQPRNGIMDIKVDYSHRLPGYERESGTIVITYTFSGGIQEVSTTLLYLYIYINIY